MRPPKFNFESVKKHNAKRKLLKEKGITVSIKYKYIYFPASYIENNKLEGKLLKWVIDSEKKLLGWKLSGENNKELLEEVSEYIRVKKTSKVFKFSIGRVIKALNIRESVPDFKNLKVEEYHESRDCIYGGIIRYVKLEIPAKQEK